MEYKMFSAHRSYQVYKRTRESFLAMLTTWRTLLILMVMGWCIVSSDAFNTDVSSPIIRHGPEGSYFGYSLTMHREMGENM